MLTLFCLCRRTHLSSDNEPRRRPSSIHDITTTTTTTTTRNSPASTLDASILTAPLALRNGNQPLTIGAGRNGAGSLNRGIEYLRNAFFGYGSPSGGTAGGFGRVGGGAVGLPQYTVQTHNDTSNGSSNGSHDLPVRRFATPEHEHFLQSVDPHRHRPATNNASDWPAPITTSTPIEAPSLDQYDAVLSPPSASFTTTTNATTTKPPLLRNGFRLPTSTNTSYGQSSAVAPAHNSPSSAAQAQVIHPAAPIIAVTPIVAVSITTTPITSHHS